MRALIPGDHRSPITRSARGPWVFVLSSVLYFAFLFVASFFVARMSYEYFERYFLGLKRYFVPRTRPTEPPPLAAKAQHAN